MIPNVTGFGYSGSSAAACILNEYGYKYIERETMDFDFPHGIFELENKLYLSETITNNNEAILSFLEMVENIFCYDSFMGGKTLLASKDEYIKLYNRFIENICIETGKMFPYRNQYNVWVKCEKLSMCLKRIPVISGIRVKGKALDDVILGLYKQRLLKQYKNPVHIVTATRTEYYRYAKELIEEVIKLKYKNEEMVFHHLVRPGNTNKSVEYFDGQLRSIIVYRDPRDQYIYMKNAGKINNVEGFVKLYKRNMQFEEYNSVYTLLIRLEELIFEYDDATKRIEAFMGLEGKKGLGEKMFYPEESAKRSYMFRLPEYQTGIWIEEMRYIESELKEYLYDFSKVKI